MADRDDLPEAPSIQVLYWILLGGVFVIAAVFVALSRRLGPLMASAPAQLPWFAYGLSMFALGTLAYALVVARPRIPQRPPSQSVADYWLDSLVRGPAILLWVCCEGASILSLVGFLLTGSLVPLAVALAAVGTFLSLSPGRLAGE